MDNTESDNDNDDLDIDEYERTGDMSCWEVKDDETAVTELDKARQLLWQTVNYLNGIADNGGKHAETQRELLMSVNRIMMQVRNYLEES